MLHGSDPKAALFSLILQLEGSLREKVFKCFIKLTVSANSDFLDTLDNLTNIMLTSALSSVRNDSLLD
jgi:hypothetical protein